MHNYRESRQSVGDVDLYGYLWRIDTIARAAMQNC